MILLAIVWRSKNYNKNERSKHNNTVFKNRIGLWKITTAVQWFSLRHMSLSSHSLRLVYSVLITMCSGHTGLKHSKQYFPSFLSFVEGQKEHYVFSCNAFAVCRSGLWKISPRPIIPSFVELRSKNFFALQPHF